ncbi:glutenin, high molecular weight subunit DX5-like [Piliocolobus tephrosceles]|uniref:glutenin, high molecular weight subunit DX5-like n=1 Tax=Piliocolobus tephrosceles TaxID=591936 RepID=UPI000E6AFA33|nr:glutenin, high molecular weight subunit DX5-like [Piliocolobus tephrosceles]
MVYGATSGMTVPDTNRAVSLGVSLATTVSVTDTSQHSPSAQPHGGDRPGVAGAEGSTIWRGGSARPLGGKRVRWAEPVEGPRRGEQEERGGLSPALPEQQPQRVGVLSWGPQEGRGPRGQHQEKGGGSPAVQERGEARAGVQERGEGSPRRLLQQPEPAPEAGEGPRERGEGPESSGELGERQWESVGREAVVLGAAPERRSRPELVGRARPVGPRGPAGEGRLGVQEANWLPGVQEGQVVRAVQETYLNGKEPQEGEGPGEGPRTRRRRRRRRW